MQGYPFFAHAELAVENSDVHLTARLCELSREGCRLEVKNRPLVGTSVLVKIYANGVAVAFSEIESRYVSVLNACLLEAEQKQRNRTVD